MSAQNPPAVAAGERERADKIADWGRAPSPFGAGRTGFTETGYTKPNRGSQLSSLNFGLTFPFTPREARPLSLFVHLPRPADRLADCVWLPRIIAKARLLRAGKLPQEYAARFGHPTGVDGQFLSFFGLTKDDILAVSDRSDDAIVAWFRSAPERATRTEEWNRVALNLGRPGFPMAERLPVALATTYQHLQGERFETIFEVLEADERESRGSATG